ncbi:MAG: hypothetical protein UR69_C0001G0001 [Candidatus Moranbacteria bacterium GW2011_GWE2_35_2-]|nr:MAG: hypothetical protein UR69_C0001G0001 [Candidatus Moranbacteria bacterium GW2011_GWE2_35_2-]KKQ23001.1 MAG: hypothetical protein US37_C0001G0273 [Candidatus Moranbacteria bacterium GW2011_GWF2_37_11]KKQ29359.1 MAG: hypothetical protein US44_C0002G0141 [Candidatus Moranbacteria bacterium GW2011_GWD1_37_17]KKQ30768.1 MAG: hypothetical protein US47_C0001G0001 [Candidatus Moranbacteria bacterium GW2011_GWE1_37_24]KKQ46846.1 MAG: hypothetical protein US66_C0026G0001 [Candidatus Moranbacteria 
MSNTVKRIIIISIYFLVFFGIVFSVYKFLQPKPTCSDGILNQNEEQVDCGGVCEACIREISVNEIEIVESGFVYGGNNKFDAFAKIKNPNHQYGSSFFEYHFILKDSGGNIVGEKKESGFILPYETKYIIETNIESNQSPVELEVIISNEQWEEFSGYEEPALGIYNKRFSDSEGGVFTAEAAGLMRNDSYFDFGSIKVNIILRNEQEDVVAVNTSVLNTIKSGEEREFRVTWPYRFDFSVRNFEAEAEADVYDADNFIQGYLTGRRIEK